MKTLFAWLVLFFATSASAACYQIITPDNQVVWRGTTTPVAMDSAVLNDAVQKKVPGGHLIISGDDAQPCTPLDLTRTGNAPRKKSATMKRD